MQQNQNRTYSERNIYDIAAFGIKHIHDIRMVRQPVAAPAPHKRLVAHATGHTTLVARGRIGILPAHTGQHHRLRHQRRPLLAHATEGDTRSYLDKRIHHHSHDMLSRATTALEPRSSIPLPRRSRVLRVLEVKAHPNPTKKERNKLSGGATPTIHNTLFIIYHPWTNATCYAA